MTVSRLLSRAAIATTLLALALPIGAHAAVGPALPPVNLRHLDWLRRDIARPGQAPLATWQIYASPVRKGVRSGPYRFVGDDDEGVGCVDDVARAAIVYSRHFARTGNQHARKQAQAAFAFLEATGHPDGTYTNFVWADGSLNKNGPTSKAGLTWWTARALWALAEGAKAFRRVDDAYAATLRARAFTTVWALQKDLEKRDGQAFRYGEFKAPGWFVNQAPDVTAVMVLGLAALHREQPDPAVAQLIERYGAAIAAWAPAPKESPLWGAHLPGLGPTTWHAYGAHMLEALAAGGAAIDSAPMLAAARREADRFTPRLLIAGGPIEGFSPGLNRYPQIAYGLEPAVSGLLALSDATGEARYAKLAGLFAAWLLGDNETKKPMYDPRTGRVWDGIDAKGQSEDSGAESTIEGLWVLEALHARPELAPYFNARTRAVRGPRFIEAGKMPGARKTTGLTPGVSAALLKPGERLSFNSGPAGGRYGLMAVTSRARAIPGEKAALSFTVGHNVLTRPVAWPPAKAPWPAAEGIAWTGAAPMLPARGTVTLRYSPTAKQDLKLEGLMLTPEVEYRLYDTPNGPVAVAFNHASAARTLTLPGFGGSIKLPSESALIVERPANSPQLRVSSLALPSPSYSNMEPR